MWCINTGLYTYRLSGLSEDVVDSLKQLYPKSLSQNLILTDFQIDVSRTSMLRTLFRPQVAIKIDGHQPFNPISPKKLLPSIEWAMNWCVAAYDHTHLLIHCSVVEKNGKVILFPAKSGSGKSTTSAYLALHDWHLFYDEMAIINMFTGEIQPVFRPTSLKNNSVDIIKPFVKEHGNAYLSKVVRNTHKGDIGHLRTHSREAFDKLTPAKPIAIVFLDYNPSASLSIYEVDQSIGFSKLISNAFNYSVIGEPAFDALVSMVSNASIFEVSYSDLVSLTEFLEEIIIE